MEALSVVVVWETSLRLLRLLLERLRGQAAGRVLGIFRQKPPAFMQLVCTVIGDVHLEGAHLLSRAMLQPEIFVIILHGNDEEALQHMGGDASDETQAQWSEETHSDKEVVRCIGEAQDMVLALCGLPPRDSFLRCPNSEVDAPYFLSPFDAYERRRVPIAKLRSPIALAKAGSLKLMAVTETPHYGYLLGKVTEYEHYIDEHLGKEINEDHTAPNFELLLKDFEYGRQIHGRVSLIIGQYTGDSDLIRILDGNHRAAIMAHRGETEVEICLLAANA